MTLANSSKTTSLREKLLMLLVLLEKVEKYEREVPNKQISDRNFTRFLSEPRKMKNEK